MQDISRSGTAIKNLMEQSKDFAEKVKVIVSDNGENLYLKDFYKAMGVECYLLDFEQIDLPRKEKNGYLSDQMLEIFLDRNIDYCFCFGNHLLRGTILTEYACRIINFHPGLLPQYPGRGAVEQAIHDKQGFLGSRAHFIDESVDEGPVILQNVILARKFMDDGYGAIIYGQISLLTKLDELLSRKRIHVVNHKVIIDGGDYGISQIYPGV